MADAVDEPKEDAGTPLCLEPCPKCRAAKYRGGACHLTRSHVGQHECNAVGGELHRWR